MGKENYVIGIDLGISNVGWAIIDEETGKIIDLGVSLYESSGDAKNRRLARSARRIKKRRNHRIERLAVLFHKNGINPKRTIDDKLVYKRKAGLTEKLDIQEIVNIIYCMAVHRGYIPYDDQDIRDCVSLSDDQYPCEILIDHLQKYNKYRARNDLLIKQEDNMRELRTILDTQSRFYPVISGVINDIIKICESKREFYEGPGGPKINQLTPYGRYKVIDDLKKYDLDPSYNKYLYENLIGKCKVSINEPCAPKSNYYAEKFNFMNDCINLRVNPSLLKQEYISKVDENGRLKLATIEEIEKTILDSKTIQIDKLISEILGVNPGSVTGYRLDKKKEVIEFSTFEFYRYIIKKFKDAGLSLEWIESKDKSIYNKVCYALTVSPSSNQIFEILSDRVFERTFSNEEISVLMDIKRKRNQDSFTYHALSEKTLKMVLTHMHECDYKLNYMQIFTKYDYEKEYRNQIEKFYTRKTKMPYLIECYKIEDDIANPQVKKTVRKAINIINTIIKSRGYYPSCIAIESTREMNEPKRAKQITKEQNKFQQKRNNAKEILEKNNYTINNKNIEKILCHIETNGHCAYCRKPVPLSSLMATDIEHILPISDSFDDSFDNKTCSCSACNQEKLKRTAYEYLTAKGNYDDFEKHIKTLDISPRKIENFTYKDEISKYKIKFINRNLRDVAYGSRMLKDQIQKFNIFLKFKLKSEDSNINVITVPGQLTTKVRHQIDLGDKNRDSYEHHAEDAAIIASIASSSAIGKILMKVQNDVYFIKQNKDFVKGIGNIIRKFTIDNIAELKRITTDENTQEKNYLVKRSFEIKKDSQKQISNQNIVKIIERNGFQYKVSQIDNIYDYNKNAFKELLDESNTSIQLICQYEDKKLFDYIKGIYFKFKDEKGNPFINACIHEHGLESAKEFNYLIHGIRKPSKKENAPIIKRLRYIKRSNVHYPVNNNNAKKNRYGEFTINTMNEKRQIAIETLSQFKIEVYYEKSKKAFIFFPINTISVNFKTNEVNKDDNLYKEQYDKYLGGKNVVKICDLYIGSLIKVYKRGGKILTGTVNSFDKTNNSIDFYENGEKDNVKGFVQSDKRIILYTTNCLGKIYKVVDSDEKI